MQRIEQREREKVEKSLKIKQEKQREITKEFLADDSIRIIIDYCEKILLDPVKEDLTEYSPASLSKFIFENELNEIKRRFQELPNQQCVIEHFLLIMIKVMNFPFEKWPFFLVGFKEMFYEIASKKTKVINFQQFFKYVIGEVLDFKEEQQNTEFQVRFQELKKQDYLLHDNGIKRFYYSMDSKSFFTLDESTYMIKIYNKNMKLTTKFIPNKEKHGKRLPHILWFDYSEMTNRLAITLADNTLSIINLTNLLTKSRGEFDSLPSNELVVHFDDKLVKVFYIQMLNRWALFTEQNKFYVFDQEKYRQNDPQYLTTVKMENPDLLLCNIVELVNLSTICVIAGNQIQFYNENFTEKKHSLFSHSSNITNFHYCEETGSYYLCGLQKDITVFHIPRGSDNFKIKTLGIPLKNNIKSFQVFPAMNTLLVVDQIHQIKLFDLTKGTCYQIADYSQIVKNQKNFIKTLHVSKNEFAIYETYTLLFEQQKIAIEKDTEFHFILDTFYDQSKQEFYFSVNHQIISFSLVQGEIRKSYNHNTSNVQKIESFKKGKQTDLFIIDHEKYIYEAYLRDNQPDGQYKNYKKKINIGDVLQTFYDEETQFVFIIGSRSLFLVKNDKYNNFNINSSLNIEQLPSISLSKYNERQKEVTLMLQNQCWLIIDPQNLQVKERYMFIFPADLRDHQQELILGFEHDIDFDLDIILTNKNKLYLVSKTDRKKHIQIFLEDLLPRNLRSLSLHSMKYFPQSEHCNKHIIILCDHTGYLLQLNITKILTKNFQKFGRDLIKFTFPIKDTRNIQPENLIESISYSLEERTIAKLEKKDIKLIKAHEKQIKIVQRIYLQGMKIISISIQGLIKLWQDEKCLFELKLPDLKKMFWDMKEIENVKNKKSISEVIAILDKVKFSVRQKKSPEKLLQHNDPSMSLEKEMKKFNLEEPIPIEIENKDLQQIIQKTQQMNWYSARTQNKRRNREADLSPNETNYHPWRTRNSFIKIMEKASPENKYKRKMPFDLMYLRNSLDMQERRQLTNKKKQSKKQLFILPELNSYTAQKKTSGEKEAINNNLEVIEDNQETFESCLYVQKSKNHKKINEFDEIDKEFKKKWMLLTAKKWIPSKEKKTKSISEYKSNRSSKAEISFTPISKEYKHDPIRQVKQIFESHNKETAATKRGRYIKIPELSLKREDLFPE